MSRNGAGSLLAEVPGEVDSVFVMRSCLGDLLQVVEREPGLVGDAARWLEAMAHQGELPEEEFGHDAWVPADEFLLAEQGTYGSIDEVRSSVLAFLREHARRDI